MHDFNLFSTFFFLELFMSTTQNNAVVELQAKDLPATCPNPSMPLWPSHPRVYLDVSHGHPATCSYCGTTYQLAPGVVVKGH
jgi:uncharacterized Zn-finger protein